ncbi:MAG: hypothetical protein J7463_11870 [Roseiflexus sp.]|nr:hypothetical protein [Roseiflexus sp.]MBO9335791.1 hypothetical protein [Roseiflexus sp.]MBO9365280.1 hypothetical protein [Roseiflexus sp.]MBO9382333.1 hypothetical protein [Roseiflexus sp.]MBO9388610.1 hypothetical protein [Roseiflexus sp.]
MPKCINAAGLRAVIQFFITSTEPGDYYLSIVRSEYFFNECVFDKPTYLTRRYRVEATSGC